ncbi:MAG TPA: hypothetical protein VGG22_13305 [Candidatus Baltobacteraceae bacterium]
MKLIETIVCVAIIVIVTAGFGAYTLGRKSYALRAAVQSFAAFLDDARAVAQTSGTGATIEIAGDTQGGFIATLYPYRPLEGADLSSAPVRTLKGNVALTPVAIFISSSGTASTTSWTVNAGVLSSEPACDTTIGLTFSDGVATEAHTIPCGQAVLQ